MGRKKKKPVRTLACPNCGALFPSNRLACPECGSDAETGWKPWDEIEYESVELPEEESDDSSPLRRAGVLMLVAWMALILAGIGFCSVF